jgi:hypothetical protein
MVGRRAAMTGPTSIRVTNPGSHDKVITARIGEAQAGGTAAVGGQHLTRLDDLIDVEADDATSGQTIVLGADRVWRGRDVPAPPGISYHHVQLSANDTWFIQHRLGYRPNVTVTDAQGDEVEPDRSDPDLNTTILLFNGRSMSGEADLS